MESGIKLQATKPFTIVALLKGIKQISFSFSSYDIPYIFAEIRIVLRDYSIAQSNYSNNFARTFRINFKNYLNDRMENFTWYFVNNLGYLLGLHFPVVSPIPEDAETCLTIFWPILFEGFLGCSLWCDWFQTISSTKNLVNIWLLIDKMQKFGQIVELVSGVCRKTVDTTWGSKLCRCKSPYPNYFIRYECNWR